MDRDDRHSTSEAVATVQYPLSPTVVKRCVVAPTSCRLSEGMEPPSFRQLALQHYTAFRILAETHWSAFVRCDKKLHTLEHNVPYHLIIYSMVQQKTYE
jgi:hypothetical protein